MTKKNVYTDASFYSKDPKGLKHYKVEFLERKPLGSVLLRKESDIESEKI